jgi:hypothetical protein
LIDNQGLIDDFDLRQGVKRCALVYNLPDGWLIDYQGLIDGFMFEAGCESECPRVQPLLMVVD